MPPKKNVAADAGDSSGGEEINLQQVVETKKELDKIRKDRDKKRTQLQADLNKQLADLRARVQETVTAHVQKLGDIHQDKVNRLLPAIEARDTILKTIGGKLTEIQSAGEDIATYLDGAYEHRLKKAEKFVISAEDQNGQQGKDFKAGAA